MSRLRAVTAILVLISALAAGGLSLHSQGHEVLRSYDQSPWLSALLLAYCFGTLLVPFGLADIREPIARTLKTWAILLFISSVVWFGPLLLAPHVGWSWDNCLTASMMIMLVPSLLEPVELLRKLRRDQPRKIP